MRAAGLARPFGSYIEHKAGRFGHAAAPLGGQGAGQVLRASQSVMRRCGLSSGSTPDPARRGTGAGLCPCRPRAHPGPLQALERGVLGVEQDLGFAVGALAGTGLLVPSDAESGNRVQVAFLAGQRLVQRPVDLDERRAYTGMGEPSASSAVSL